VAIPWGPGILKGCFAALVTRIHICSAVQQEPDFGHMPFLSGGHQRRLPVFISGIYVGTSIDQFFIKKY